MTEPKACSEIRGVTVRPGPVFEVTVPLRNSKLSLVGKNLNIQHHQRLVTAQLVSLLCSSGLKKAHSN